MRKIILKILILIYSCVKNTRVRRYLEKKIAAFDGGFYYSHKIRDIYKEYHGLSIGYGTYGGCWNNSAMWWSNIRIGNYCSFAGHVSLFTCDHPMDLFTTHPITYDIYNSGASEQRNFSKGQNYLNVGHGVWFGADSIVLSGCKTIGNGAVIGAGSVVTHDVPPYAVVVGNPARIIRYRLTPDQIEKVEASKWWLLKRNELNDRMEEFLNLTR